MGIALRTLTAWRVISGCTGSSLERLSLPVMSQRWMAASLRECVAIWVTVSAVPVKSKVVSSPT
jgi:hypothetical protein